MTSEQPGTEGEVVVTLAEQTGLIHADLSVGANVTDAVTLSSNCSISSRGVMLFGAGFIVTPEEAATLGDAQTNSPQLIRAYRNGRDLTERPRDVRVIDAFGLSAEQLRSQHPAVYQWLLERVKPERDQNRDKQIKQNWWLHGRARSEIRPALASLPRYIATVETAKHRVFQFLDVSILPDNKLIAIALSDAFHLGVLSSQTHITWALATGSWLGVGNDPVYVKSRCFETFPFPTDATGMTLALRQKISDLAEQIDQHRKRVLGLLPSNASPSETSDKPGREWPGADFWAFDSMRPPAIPAPAHPQAPPLTVPDPSKDLTLTGLYNVLQALREGRALTPKEKQIHSAGLVSVLKELHDELDAAVLQAYGWSDLAHSQNPKDALLTRLVTLNAQRAADEAQGTVYWLRPEFQNPQKTLSKQELLTQVQQGLEVDFSQENIINIDSKKAASQAALPNWPATLPEQVRAVALLLAQAQRALTLPEIEAQFTGRGTWKKSLPTLLQTLQALGRAQQTELNGHAAWRA